MKVILVDKKEGKIEDLEANDFVKIWFKDNSKRHALFVGINDQSTGLNVIPVENAGFETFSLGAILKIEILARNAIEAFTAFSHLYAKYRKILDAIDHFKKLLNVETETVVE